MPGNSKFNPEQRHNQPSQFTNVSRGSTAESGNDGTGDFLSGLGGLITTAVSGTQQTIKADISEGLREDVDLIRGEEFGVNDATNFQADVGEDIQVATPSGLAKSGQELDRLKQAYSNGRLRESHYWARLNSSVRQMRARYPGHSDFIDQKIASLTGGIPANRVRQELEREATAANSGDTPEKRRLRFIASNAEYLPADWEEREGTNKQYTFNQLVAHAGQTQRRKIEQQERERQLDLSDANAKTAKRKIKEALQFKVTDSISDLMGQATGTLGRQYGELLEQMKEYEQIRKSRPLTEEETRQVRLGLANIKNTISASIESVVNSPIREGTHVTYRHKLSGDDIKEATSAANLIVARVEKAMTDGNFGILTDAAVRAKANQESTRAAMLDQYPQLLQVEQIRGSLGDPVVNQMYTTNEKFRGSFEHMLSSIAMTSVASGAKTLNEAVDDAKRETDDPAVFRNILNKFSKVLSDKDIKDESISNIAVSVFSSDSLPRGKTFTSKFSKGEREDIFLKLTQEGVANRLFYTRNGDGGKPWDTFKGWTRTNSHSLLKTLVEDANSLIINRRFQKLGFDKNNFLFTLEEREGASDRFFTDIASGNANPVAGAINLFNETVDIDLPGESLDIGVSSTARNTVNRLNKLTRGLVSVWKAEGKDVEKELFNFLGKDNLGIKFDAKPTKPGLELFFDGVARGVRRGLGLDLGDLATESDKAKPILDVIGQAEAPKGYNQIYGGKEIAGLTEMTIDEVFDVQGEMLAAQKTNGVPSTHRSSAIGRYQFISKTLRGLVNKMGVDPAKQQFTEEFQDKLAIELMKEVGYDKYISGKLTAKQFMKKLSTKWAGIPNPDTGKSHYQGVGSNKATIGVEEVMKTLEGNSPKG